MRICVLAVSVLVSLQGIYAVLTINKPLAQASASFLTYASLFLALTTGFDYLEMRPVDDLCESVRSNVAEVVCWLDAGRHTVMLEALTSVLAVIFN